MSSAEQKRLSKLPPRLAKQREQSLKEKKQQKASAMPAPNMTVNMSEIPSLFAAQPLMGADTNTFQIENWDNEMANNIPLSNGEGMVPDQQQMPQQPQPSAQQQQPGRSLHTVKHGLKKSL